MNDRYREAFEAWAATHTSLDTKNRDSDGRYYCGDSHLAYCCWQAARDHYAPKLTEEGLEEVYLIYATTVMDLTDGDTREGLKAALRAAGVKFRG